MKVLCRHCQNSCKKIGLVECSKYNAKADKPEQLRKEIAELYKQGKHEQAKEKQQTLEKYLYVLFAQ